MSDIQKQFEQKLLEVKEAKMDFKPNNNQLLKLYGFYKQATEGDITTECPSMMNLKERAKWNAWNSIKGMDKETAMKGYLKVFEE